MYVLSQEELQVKLEMAITGRRKIIRHVGFKKKSYLNASQKKKARNKRKNSVIIPTRIETALNFLTSGYIFLER